MTSTQIDFEQSSNEHRTIINSNVDDVLDGIRREWDALEDMLGHIARQLQRTMPLPDKSLNVLYFPQIGFLMSADRDRNSESESHLTLEPEGWELMFTTEYVVSSPALIYVVPDVDKYEHLLQKRRNARVGRTLW